LRETVERKRKWCSLPRREFAELKFFGWHERGYLPHRDEPGLIQFVTFRLADSLPMSLRTEWEHFWQIKEQRTRRLELQAYLDRGRGECHLRRAEVAALVEAGLRHFHGDRYELRAWVVMPNHVHVLFRIQKTAMAKIVESWKKYTARVSNQILGRSGAFWEADYWEMFMRDPEHEMTTCSYIESNPVKARLVNATKDWPWSSARFRDESGELRI
jgi:REP element-mobilizing transposase RayT